jgi:hypothetical protein
MVIYTSAPQIVHPNPSSPTPARLEKSIEGDSNFDHVPINKYLWHSRPSMAKIDVGSRLIIMAASMNHL